jgi:hypothetical protein
MVIPPENIFGPLPSIIYEKSTKNRNKLLKNSNIVLLVQKNKTPSDPYYLTNGTNILCQGVKMALLY